MRHEEWYKRMEAAQQAAKASRDSDELDQDVTELIAEIATNDDWRKLAELGFSVREADNAQVAAAVNARAKSESEVARARALIERPEQARPVVQRFDELNAKPPAPILGIAGAPSGAVLTDGGVLVFAGEGGVGKSALAAQIAHGVASENAKDIGGMFLPLRHGPVLYATFEDPPGITGGQIAWHNNELVAADADLPAYVIDMSGHPLFGPVDRVGGDTGFYNQRPDRLPGWDYLWEAANDIRPVLIVLDAATDAYTGDANQVPQVASFMVDLRTTARKAEWVCGVMLVAHSTKAARKNAQKFDPFDPGRLAGSAAWTDKARGVVGFMWDGREGSQAGDRVLSILKANYGVARILCRPTPRQREDGRVMAFEAENWKMPDDKDAFLWQPKD